MNVGEFFRAQARMLQFQNPLKRFPEFPPFPRFNLKLGNASEGRQHFMPGHQNTREIKLC